MPKLVDHEKYRQDLLERSFDCFAEHGYAAVTMRDLAKHLGVSTGTLYHYFRSKEELFEALIDYLTGRDLGLGDEIAKLHESVEARIFALFALLDEQKDYFLKQTCLWVDFFRHSGEGALSNPAIRRSQAKHRSWIMSFLQIEDPDLVTMLCCLVNGLIMELMGPRDHISFERQARLFVNLLDSYSPGRHQ